MRLFNELFSRMKDHSSAKRQWIMAVLSVLALPLLFQGVMLQPREAMAATISCSNGLSGCHFKTGVLDSAVRNVPGGLFLGTHARHSGYSTGSKKQYQYACDKCHPSTGYGNAHQTGFKNITGSSLPGTSYSKGKKIANTNTPAFGNCSQIYCHSNGRATGLGQKQYSSVRWGGTEACLGCHGGRSTVSPYNPARSVANFTLSTTHSQHLKYPAANMNCQICHSKTVTSATALKNYTGVVRHVNGVSDVTFTDIAYASYTSYKTSGADLKKCNNTSCHGGKSRGAWTAASTNNNYTCVHCHGIDGTTSSADVRVAAPGFRRQGTSTDQLVRSDNIRVGSHFKHLSSVYMKNIKCNECHQVPSTPFAAGTNHTLNTLRFNSGTLTFAQASTARWNGVTMTNLATFTGYTNGTATKAATCSSVYCHGSRLKKGDTAGTYRKPYWNYSALINYTVGAATVCSKCHGYPPTYSGHTASTTCSSCHTNISSADNKSIIDKTKHINGTVESSSHAFPYPGATHASLAGLTPWTACSIGSCHSNGSNTNYPVTAGTAPDCTACHKLGLKTPSGTSSCWDCHGASATDGRPNSNAFPNWSGSHTAHVVNQAMACSVCHGPYGGNIGDTRHGFSNRTAHTFAAGFVNVTSTTSKFHFTRTNNVTGTCSTIACHSGVQWGGTKLACNSCHAYDTTDSGTTWLPNLFLAGGSGAGAHVKHINFIKGRLAIASLTPTGRTFGTGEPAGVCGTCHTNLATDHTMNSIGTRNINFGSSTYTMGTGYGGSMSLVFGSNPSFDGTGHACSNVSCHYFTTPNWY